MKKRNMTEEMEKGVVYKAEEAEVLFVKTKSKFRRAGSRLAAHESPMSATVEYKTPSKKARKALDAKKVRLLQHTHLRLFSLT